MTSQATRYFKNIVYYLSVFLAIVILATTLLSLISDTSWRYYKMLDFPRIQYFILGGIVLVVFIWITEKWRWYDYLFAAMIVASMICQGTRLIHYTPLVSKAVPDATSTAEGLKMMVYNLYIENEDYDSALRMMQESDADVLVTLETTPIWEEKLTPLRQDYPHATASINEVGYGMTIYSKYPMEDLEKHYLQNKNVPSYGFKIQPEGMPKIQVYSVHPPPPKYFEEMPDNKGKKEKALTMIGDKMDTEDIPTIVFGDLNDVAWGNTERLMQAGGRLRDVRVGRGFYNTFNVHSILMKWPLDHFFVTDHFGLRDIKLLDNAGSDHYPVYVELSYEK